MNSKTKKAIAAWKQAMQQDLDRLNKLTDDGRWYSEEANRLRDCLDKAIELVNRKYDVCTSFSQGKQVVMQTVNRLGCLVTL